MVDENDPTPESRALTELDMFGDFVVAEALRRGIDLQLVVVAAGGVVNLQTCLPEGELKLQLMHLALDPGYHYGTENYGVAEDAE